MKIVTFDFFLRQTKTQDLMWFGKWTAKISSARAKPCFFMQHCSDSQNIFLYRFTSEKDQIDDWFLFENGEDLVSLCPSGPGRFVSLRPVFRDPGLREFRNPHDKTFADRWYDEIDGMISSVQQRTRNPLVVAGSGRVEAGPFSRNLANEKFTYDTTPTPTSHRTSMTTP
jgi:hypothetical protein